MKRPRHILMTVTMAILVGPFAVQAQQDPLYSQYMFNTLAFNPGYAGSAKVFTVMALSRHQWVGFDGAPATQTLSLHSPLKKQQLALGMNLVHDKLGPVQQTAAYFDVAYRIRTGDASQLAFGLMGGANLYQADLASLETVDEDPNNQNVSGQIMPNFGFGLFWHTERAYLGLSAPKLLQNDLSVDGEAQLLTTAEEERHYFLIGGIVVDAGPDLKFKPSLMVRAVEGSPLSADINANFLLRDRIWFGGMYRWDNAFGIMAQYKFNEQFSAGYAFDMSTTTIGAYNAGTHELMLSYDLKFTRGQFVSPRYF